MNNKYNYLVGNNKNDLNINSKQNNHALLSASSAHKWLNCTPSAILELEFANKETDLSKEGSATHELCEYKLKKVLNIKMKKPSSTYHCEEMEMHMEKLMGRSKFNKIMGDQIYKPAGKLTLVPISDRRQAISMGNEFIKNMEVNNYVKS